ncbi:SDR family oxidoreductase [Azospirillum sp. TSH64]|uniref:dTDP-4-dehydrorhamnose reductase family protein n=1 Tax=Azospirillum sp. TSH64 TaxID=652740 RepID=UPI000D68E99D|nr:SDR family oxidoreductase [Azospirillum sp. TSH64]
MNILILGGNGMLGHRMVLHFLKNHNVAYTVRGNAPPDALPSDMCFPNVDVCNLTDVMDVFIRFKPDAVLNCAGLVKQKPMGQSVVASSIVNSVAPHQLASLCRTAGARFVHISTDCVFSGRRGNYTEDDQPDPVDVYGMTKLLGEVNAPGCLTLRTSIIGRELNTRHGLLEWFLHQKEAVKGFSSAIFSGVTTVELARIVENLLVGYPQAEGLYHVSAAPISKYDLLRLVSANYDHSIPIMPDDSFLLDRSLDSSLFRRTFSYAPPGWSDMIQQARAEENKSCR